jgi:hypothetical protein
MPPEPPAGAFAPDPARHAALTLAMRQAMLHVPGSLGSRLRSLGGRFREAALDTRSTRCADAGDAPSDVARSGSLTFRVGPRMASQYSINNNGYSVLYVG